MASIKQPAATAARPAARTARHWALRRAVVPIAMVIVVLGAVALSGRIMGDRDLLLPLGVVLMVGLAYANGANDVSKAIATLAGSGVTNYRRAIAWGACCTVIGALCSALVAGALVGTFTRGFIAKGAQQTEVFALAILVGAILWVVLSSRTGLPVSTTHAMTGALVTVGAFAFGADDVQWGSVVQKVAVPLLVSPFLALGLALATYIAIHVTLARGAPRAMNALHWLSSGTASFARGLNDSPKIVALGVACFLITQHSTKFQTPYWLFMLVAAGIGLGSLLGGLKVTETLAEKVTTMDHAEGLSANLVTALLVAVASNLGLPVSTTHVSSGAVIGVGLREGTSHVNWRVVRDMALAWVVTLPGAGMLGLAAYLVFELVHGGA